MRPTKEQWSLPGDEHRDHARSRLPTRRETSRAAGVVAGNTCVVRDACQIVHGSGATPADDGTVLFPHYVGNKEGAVGRAPAMELKVDVKRRLERVHSTVAR